MTLAASRALADRATLGATRATRAPLLFAADRARRDHKGAIPRVSANRLVGNVFVVCKSEDDIGVALFADRTANGRVRQLGTEKSVFGIGKHDRHAAARIAVWGYPTRALVQLDIRRVARDLALKAGDH